MKTIYLLTYEDVVLSSLAAPLDILTRTNEILLSQDQAPAFAITRITPQAGPLTVDGISYWRGDCTIEDRPAQSFGHPQALILIPAFQGSWDQLKHAYADVLLWLQQHYQAGTEVASLCKGSYFLAEAGVLKGKPCTSHWAVTDDMRQRFPEIQLKPDAVVTDESGTYTGGGAFSSLNLLLYLIEKFCGHELGVQVAKNFSIQRDHASQAHFSIFTGMTHHRDPLIREAQAYMEAHYHQALNLETVAQKVHMSKRNFIRRFKQAVDMPPLEYLQRIKIEAAKKALEAGHLSIQSLTLEVGYNDSKTFRQVFKRLTGLTPQAYRQKYAR
ncbi:GlxA family transcriptional regulator [Gilvimarinus algae]|uniref:Helix-turn-helix domain-containing protein n=1 Tax=Gilvimarinus algae TaxID=3058037 RepID=A0ABT8TAJ2_9GAMM|nr:helix-turn-helix domain-containing protein [Gilvimarinus sp. SDUM040014]MDO3381139.1 helix-turn-helix domain-containing protein [Gilvimarinus sp. SDUM040014]